MLKGDLKSGQSLLSKGWFVFPDWFLNQRSLGVPQAQGAGAVRSTKDALSPQLYSQFRYNSNKRIWGKIRLLCYVRHQNCTAPGTPISTHFIPGSLGLGCSDKAQSEAPEADKPH